MHAYIFIIFGCIGVPSNNRNFRIQLQGYAMLICLPQLRTNVIVNLSESVICLVPGELWNFLEARMLYDKCIENQLWSYPLHMGSRKSAQPSCLCSTADMKVIYVHDLLKIPYQMCPNCISF